MPSPRQQWHKDLLQRWVDRAAQRIPSGPEVWEQEGAEPTILDILEQLLSHPPQLEEEENIQGKGGME